MKSKITSLSFMLLATILLFGRGYAVPENDEPETLVGLVVSADEDEDGNVKRVALSVITVSEDSDSEDADETVEDYLIVNEGKGKELLQLVGREIEAVGFIKTDDAGSKSLVIKSYKVLDEREESYDDQEQEDGEQ